MIKTTELKETAAYSRWVRLMGDDQRLYAMHISLFTAIFVCWQRSGFISPFSVNRRELMAFSKIASIATYHKCIRELDTYGYILYRPSFHPKIGSLIYWSDKLN